MMAPEIFTNLKAPQVGMIEPGGVSRPQAGENLGCNEPKYQFRPAANRSGARDGYRECWCGKGVVELAPSKA
jgi:hypothetical protein